MKPLSILEVLYKKDYEDLIGREFILQWLDFDTWIWQNSLFTKGVITDIKKFAESRSCVGQIKLSFIDTTGKINTEGLSSDEFQRLCFL